ncbi:MAG: hypothetical protein CFE26_15035, partial [Verrucomicrobiales bacterium VVV1]
MVTVPVSGQSFTEALRVTVATATPEKPWNVQVGAKLSGAIKSNDRILIRYMARSVGEGKGQAVATLQLGKPSYAMIGMTETAKFGAAWEQVNLAFIAKLDAPAGQGEIALFLGDQ